MNSGSLLLLSNAATRRFSPASLPGLALWLDPTRGLFQERTGAAATTPAVADGDPVGTWQARTGQYFTAPSDAARPTLQTVNGNRVLRYDGVDDTLATASGPAWSALQHAVFAQARAGAGVASYDPVAISSQVADGFRMCLKTSTAPWGTYTGGGDANANTTLVVGTRYVLGMNGGAFRLNGAADGTYAASTGDAGAGGWVGLGLDSARAADIDAGHLVVCTAPLSATDLAKLEAYLSW